MGSLAAEPPKPRRPWMTAAVLVVAATACSSHGSKIADDAGVDAHGADGLEAGADIVPDATQETGPGVGVGSPCATDGDCGNTIELGCNNGPLGGPGTCAPCGGPDEICCNRTDCRGGLTCALTPEYPRYCYSRPMVDGGGDQESGS